MLARTGATIRAIGSAAWGAQLPALGSPSGPSPSGSLTTSQRGLRKETRLIDPEVLNGLTFEKRAEE